MSTVQIRNFDGVIKEFRADEVDYIKVHKYFDVDSSVKRYENDDNFKVVKMFNSIPKSHRILAVYHCTKSKGTMYYFDADAVLIAFSN